MRRIRPYLVGVAVGAMLMIGGQALADIPDTEPSAPDPAHTLHLCLKDGVTLQVAYAWDRSMSIAQGKPTCASWLGPGYKDVPVVPAIPSTPPTSTTSS